MNKKILIIILGLVPIALTVLLLSLPIKRTPPPKEEIVAPTLVPIGRPDIPASQQLNGLQTIIVGQTTDEEVSKIPNAHVVEETPEGRTYNLPSSIRSRPHEIKTSQGVAVSERLVLPAYPEYTGYMNITDVVRRYGEPKYIIKGSDFYGDFTTRYIYPERGLFFVVNTNTNEVFELIHFKNMSTEEFNSTFPNEIEEVQEVEETH